VRSEQRTSWAVCITNTGWNSASREPSQVSAEDTLNNKAKGTTRRSYGFRTFRILELALYHSLGKLPEPELTHEFF
jgi:hypothetical protein